MVLAVDQSSDLWRSNAFPRFFAYACARTAHRKRLEKRAPLAHARASCQFPGATAPGGEGTAVDGGA